MSQDFIGLRLVPVSDSRKDFFECFDLALGGIMHPEYIVH